MNAPRPSSKSDRYAESMVPPKESTLPETLPVASKVTTKSEKVRDALRLRLSGKDK